jgi:hypothetical protein
MLRNASVIRGYRIAASDGEIGTVSDFLFDDGTWSVRWLVVDTGNWLSSRKVLLPPLVLGDIDSAAQEFAVSLTKQQVKDSPGIDTDRPVSRQMESDVYQYYGWYPYWDGSYMGGYGYMGGAMASPYWGYGRREAEIAETRRRNEDPHLRSIKAVTGYHIEATDGEIGHVEDFLLSDADWSIHYLIVDTKNWWPGRKVLISPRSAQEVDWAGKEVHLDVNRQRVKESPTYDPTTIVNRYYETRFHRHYGEERMYDDHKASS